jgi:hypothetical protein
MHLARSRAQRTTLSVRLATLSLQSLAGVCPGLRTCVGTKSAPGAGTIRLGLHILIDIPSDERIFAIHFPWPISSYGFDGIRWESVWFFAVNYGVLTLVFACLWMRAKR